MSVEDLDRLRRTGGGFKGPRTPPPSQAYRDNYDRIFGKKPCANPYHQESGCDGRENECYDVRKG